MDKAPFVSPLVTRRVGVICHSVRVHTYGPEAPATPRLSQCLRALMHQVDTLWPHRTRTSDGWIGDLAHQERQSDHNPDARGIVHAVDITAARIEPLVLIVAACVHPSTNYVIYRRRIFSRSHNFIGRYYDGADPHTSHVHISILHTAKAERSERIWLRGEG